MLDPVTAFGVAVGVLQITQQLIGLGKIVLSAKPPDQKLVDAIREEAKKYISLLTGWANELTGDAKDACETLRKALQEVVDDIDEIKNTTGVRKVMTRFRV